MDPAAPARSAATPPPPDPRRRLGRPPRRPLGRRPHAGRHLPRRPLDPTGDADAALVQAELSLLEAGRLIALDHVDDALRTAQDALGLVADDEPRARTGLLLVIGRCRMAAGRPRPGAGRLPSGPRPRRSPPGGGHRARHRRRPPRRDRPAPGSHQRRRGQQPGRHRPRRRSGAGRQPRVQRRPPHPRQRAPRPRTASRRRNAPSPAAPTWPADAGTWPANAKPTPPTSGSLRSPDDRHRPGCVEPITGPGAVRAAAAPHVAHPPRDRRRALPVAQHHQDPHPRHLPQARRAITPRRHRRSPTPAADLNHTTG